MGELVRCNKLNAEGGVYETFFVTLCLGVWSLSFNIAQPTVLLPLFLDTWFPFFTGLLWDNTNSSCGERPVSRDLLRVKRDVHSGNTGELTEVSDDAEVTVSTASLSARKICSVEVENDWVSELA